MKLINKTIGVFAGSFNPWHSGHTDILNQAKKMFTQVVVVQGLNPDKPEPKLCKLVNDQYKGLLTDYITKLEKDNIPNFDKVVLIRGLRNIKDFQFEEEQLFWMRKLKPDLNVCFLICENENRFVSSSALRTLDKYKKS